ncbi:MAG TPA: DUF937 domain-containing protein [Vicinamibacterales bacterium]|nr:DUF937 domain-containing protein [Vicinamibacterales bacterium]
MNILDAILDAQGGATARQAGAAVGLSPDDTRSALSALVPALAGGLHRNASSSGGLDALIGALSGGQHSRYVEDPSLAASTATLQDGNGILGHIFGSKDVSRQVAAQAASQTGLSADVLKRLLPIAATMVMGSLATQQMRGAPAGAAGGGDLFSMLTPMLDRNGDGSVMDDVLGSVGRMFGGR